MRPQLKWLCVTRTLPQHWSVLTHYQCSVIVLPPYLHARSCSHNNLVKFYRKSCTCSGCWDCYFRIRITVARQVVNKDVSMMRVYFGKTFGINGLCSQQLRRFRTPRVLRIQKNQDKPPHKRMITKNLHLHFARTGFE